MTSPLSSLRVIGTALVLGAFLSGALAVWLWSGSNASWRAHQTQAYLAGVTTYNALQDGTTPSGGVQIRVLSPPDQARASAGQFRQITEAPTAARITNVPISADAANIAYGGPLTLAIMSPDLTYKLADLPRRDGQTAAETTGEVFRLIASFCSDPLVIGHYGDGDWVEIDGASVWGCDQAPSDWRLAASLLTVIAIGSLVTAILNLSGEFTAFAAQLRARRRVGGPTRYDSRGPQELQDIVSAVNSYLETERAQLESRAAVLSGVSHDLGTPATRLRLRAALIPDAELRQKLEMDIDQMTGMIESVLTYTRAEMSAETSRSLSLNALIDAIVADYQDTGRAVRFRAAKDVIVHGASSVFMSRQGQGVVTGDREVIVNARPISLQRALTNLIDNALKYGRRATVALETDAETATIIVEDEGSDNSAADVEALLAPFQRGDNTQSIDGYGLGLTIVATIASLHGGALSFEDTPVGVAARLRIRRQ